MEVCVDDMITKSKTQVEHPTHLKETFELLKKYMMKFNLEKCMFGVSLVKFLELMVRQREIEANLEKIWAVVKMKSPRTVKNIESLAGKLAALNRFISWATDKCHVFFQVMSKYRKMEWMIVCEEAFQQLKQYLLKASLLSMPREGDILCLYLVVFKRATSAVIVREEARI